MRRLIVEDYTSRPLRSTDIDTSISFEENFAKADTIQRANAVIASYTNANYNELQNYNQAVTEIREEVEGFSETKQDTLTAGDNITISEENVISATDTTYTAGSNVTISDENVISATDTTYTAGTGIDITNGVISNTQTSAEWGSIIGDIDEQTDLQVQFNTKQDVLISGTNIKTINSNSIMGNGNLSVQETLVSGTNIKTINNNSILGSGDLNIDITPLTTHSNSNDDVYACNYVNSISDYSLSETVVGKFEISAGVYKNVYRKVIMPNNTGSGTQSFNHEISNLDRVIKCDISATDTAYFSESKGQYSFPRMSADNYNIGVSRINDTTVEYYVPTIFGTRIQQVICILEYIKTSD